MSEEATTKFVLPDELTLSPHLEGVILGASEYLSRIGRCRISKIIYSTIAVEREEQGRTKHNHPSTVFAKLMGVSIRTIERWISGDVQSCNVNAEALLRLGLRFNKEATLSLLADEQARHTRLVKELVTGVS